MLLLGAVLEVNKVHVVFSLPFNLRGILAITDVSDLVTDLVRRKAGGTSNSDTVKDRYMMSYWSLHMMVWGGTQRYHVTHKILKSVKGYTELRA